MFVQKLLLCNLTFFSVNLVVGLFQELSQQLHRWVVKEERRERQEVTNNLNKETVKEIVNSCGSKKTIRKTCPCNEYPLKPHFYIVKLGYAKVYLFFLFLLQNIDCGYSLEPPRRGGCNVYPQSMF